MSIQLKWKNVKKLISDKLNTKKTLGHDLVTNKMIRELLGPILYLLYTADLPTSTNATTSTFADDTAIMATNKNPQTASRELQDRLHPNKKLGLYNLSLSNYFAN